MQNLSEFQIFLLFFVEGTIIGIVFDLFRSARNSFGKSDIITYFEDFLFLSFSACLIIWTIIFVCKGVVRFYIFLGTVSRNCCIFFDNKQYLCYNIN